MTTREAIAQAGGLVTLSGMARRWGISSARASVFVAQGKEGAAHWEPFPAPVEVDGMAARVWIWGEVDDWHERNVAAPHRSRLKSG